MLRPFPLREKLLDYDRRVVCIHYHTFSHVRDAIVVVRARRVYRKGYIKLVCPSCGRSNRMKPKPKRKAA